MLLTSCLFLPYVAFAAEQPSVTLDTVITEDNIDEVLNYVGLDSSDLKDGTNNNCATVQTVGELKNAIDQAKQQVSDVTFISNPPSSNYNALLSKNALSANSILTPFSAPTSPVSGSILLTGTIYGTAYTVDVCVTGTFLSSYWSGSYEQVYHAPQWTAATGLDTTCHPITSLPEWDVDSKSLYASCSPTYIIVTGTIEMGAYMNILGQRLVRVSSQTVTVNYMTYNVNDYIN